MKQSQRPLGYTIVEALIFLAVSGALFFIAATFMAGRQNRIEFTNAVRDLELQIQDIMNDVATGYYSNFAPVRCSKTDAVGTNIRVDADPSGPGGLGENADCTYVGKMIRYQNQSDGSQKALIFNLAGRRLDHSSEIPPTSYDQARVKLLATAWDHAESVTLPSIARLVRGCYDCGGAQQSPLVAFVTSFSDAVDGGLRPGSPNTDIYRVTAGGNVDLNDTNFVRTRQRIEDHTNSASRNPSTGYTLCLESTGARQFARIIIGGPAGNSTISEISGAPISGC